MGPVEPRRGRAEWREGERSSESKLNPRRVQRGGISRKQALRGGFVEMALGLTSVSGSAPDSRAFGNRSCT